MTEQAGVWLDAETYRMVREALLAAFCPAGDSPEEIAAQSNRAITALDAAEARSGVGWERLEDGALVVRNRAGGDILIDDSLWVRHLVITKLGEFSGSAFVPKENMRNVALAILHLASAAGTGGEE